MASIMDMELRQIRVLSKDKVEIEDISSVNLKADENSFSSGPCLHNKKFASVFIPCVFPLFYLAGNVLFGVSVLCIMCIYLVGHISKERKSTVVAFIISMVVLQLTTVYCLLPYVWKSLFNTGLVFIYNVFLILSGGVGLLQLKQMQLEEPSFVVHLEYILFVAYPVTGQFVMTSVSALFFGWWTAPFFCIIYGFLFVQVFLVPSQPSFLYNEAVHKTGEERIQDRVVIGPLEKTVLLFNLLSVPGSMFIVIYFMELLKVMTWVKLLCCGLLPVFMCTCLDIRDVIISLDVYSTTVNKVRCLSGIACLFMLFTLMWSSRVISAQVLPLLAGSVIFGLGIGMTAKSPQQKGLHQIIMSVLIIFYVVLIWSLVFNNLAALSYQMNMLLLEITILSVLSVISVWFSGSVNKQAFNYVLVIQSTGMIICENFLLKQSLYSVHYAMVSGAITIYVVFRLYLVDMSNWQTTWLCSSIHASKIALGISLLVPRHALEEGFFWPKVLTGHHSLVCLIFILIISKLLVFSDEKSIKINKGAKVCGVVGLSILFVYDSLILPLWILITNQWPSGADVAATVLLLWGLLCLRITLVQLSHNLEAKRLNIVVLCAAVLIEYLQPQFNPLKVGWWLGVYFMSLVWPLDDSWNGVIAEDISLPWMLMVSFITCLVLLVKLTRIEHCSVLSQALVSLLIGLPIGLKIASLFLPVDRPPLLSLSYGMSSILVVFLIFSSWIPVEYSCTHRGYSFISLVSCLLLSLLLESMSKPLVSGKSENNEWTSTSLLYFLVLYLVLGICLKRESPKAMESLEYNRGKSPPLYTTLGSSLLANISLILACALAIWCTPRHHWELWISLCTCIFLLWRPEGLIWNDGSHITPPLPASLFLIVCMYIRTILTALPLRVGIWPVIGFCMEMFFLHCALPSYLGLVYSLWMKEISLILQRLVVVCGPANIVLLVYCSTLSGRVLGLFGIASTYWIFYYVECPEWRNSITIK